jgi:quinol monooxygenase YgiN
MIKEKYQLQPLSQKQFFENWTSRMSNDAHDKHAVANYFKPYIETIPRLALGEYYWLFFS